MWVKALKGSYMLYTQYYMCMCVMLWLALTIYEDIMNDYVQTKF